MKYKYILNIKVLMIVINIRLNSLYFVENKCFYLNYFNDDNI